MALAEQQPAPNFEYQDREGNTKNFHDVKGKKIVFFFPAAFTRSCTAQACSLQDNYDNLKQEGVSEVFAVSIDGQEKIEKFQTKYQLDYIMIADEDGEISKKYDVYNNFLLKKVSGRVTYTVSEDNIIINVIDSGIRANKTESDMNNHADDILNLLNT